MRRSSLVPGSMGPQEPLIVVEESGGTDEEDVRSQKSTPRHSLDIDSPMNPYLLSPWRDPRETRKHSLPTPACSGITASQVRRLSERGGEGSGPSPREAAFLATLSQAPAPQPGGRRHSVVTISRVPSALFGRGNRRESIAAYPTGLSGSRSILSGRRDSNTSVTGPPSTEHRGSIHNLQLDIMDDIVAARKVRMKMWNTSSERVCEVEPLDEAGTSAASPNPLRYTNTRTDGTRRFSDFVGCTLPTIPSSRRRASELPPAVESTSEASRTKRHPVSGIVCSNTDLISILSSLTSSATEINRCGETDCKSSSSKQTSNSEQKRCRMKSSRSNSFDVSVLNETRHSDHPPGEQISIGPSSWFIKRHQPMANKKASAPRPSSTVVTFTNEKSNVSAVIHSQRNDAKGGNKDRPRDGAHKVVWDGRSGSVVDAQVLGSAIEVFLRRSGDPPTESTSNSQLNKVPVSDQSKGAVPKVPPRLNPPLRKSSDSTKPPTAAPVNKTSSSSTWFSGKSDDDDSADTCESSLCSTLKDLFVK